MAPILSFRTHSSLKLRTPSRFSCVDDGDEGVFMIGFQALTVRRPLWDSEIETPSPECGFQMRTTQMQAPVLRWRCQVSTFLVLSPVDLWCRWSLDYSRAGFCLVHELKMKLSLRSTVRYWVSLSQFVFRVLGLEAVLNELLSSLVLEGSKLCLLLLFLWLLI